MDYRLLKIVSLHIFIYRLSSTLHLKDSKSRLWATQKNPTSLPSIKTRGCALIHFSTHLIEIMRGDFWVNLQIKSTAMFSLNADTFALVIWVLGSWHFSGITATKLFWASLCTKSCN